MPTQAGIATDWKTVSAGDRHTCGLRTTGTLRCWGWNDSGQQGDGTTTVVLVPTQVGTATDWNTVSTGSEHTCGVRGGTLWCWGANPDGQLGDGSNKGRLVPRQVNLFNVGSVAAGHRHTVALRVG